jgi:hypothetical protein
MLWVASLLFLAIGAVVMAATLRKTAEATVELRDECVRLDELRSALDDLRQESDIARGTMDRIRSRPDRLQVDR